MNALPELNERQREDHRTINPKAGFRAVALSANGRTSVLGSETVMMTLFDAV